MHIGLALKTFFRILRDAAFAGEVARLTGADAAPKATRSPALTLLATLQREGRLVDFLKESLDGYTDAQVGAAARDVHRDLGAAVRRIFAPEPLAGEEEGSRVRVPAGFDPTRYRLTGNVAGEAPFEGTLRHHGWKARKCEMPAWTGGADSALVVAPSEVEI